jgi:hypothetical protein
MHDANFWTLFRQAAQSAGCEPSALVNFDRPFVGIQANSSAAAGCDFRFLSISSNEVGDAWPAKVVETYTRGNDTVVTYAGTDAWPFAPQIYWTGEADHANEQTGHSLSLVVSIQTDRLDTHPRIFVRSSLPAEEVLQLSVAGDELLVDSHAEGELRVDPQATACAMLWRLPGVELSYAEIVPASDFRRVRVERFDHSIGAQWEMFSEFLEKGVIRRARLQAMFVPRADDVQIVAESCQSIAQRPLPLTT